MGIFSTKKKTVVNTSFSRMIDDKDIPDAGKSALFDYLFHDKSNRNNTINTERSLTDFLALNNANSIGNTLRNSRVWASKHYAYGVPTGDVLSRNQFDLTNIMDDYLTEKLGKQLRIGYAVMQPLNALHFTWYLLKRDHSYDLDSNQLTALSTSLNTPVYLKDIQINYCSNTIRDLVDPDLLIQLGTPATYGITATRTENFKRAQTAYVEDATAAQDYAKVTYCYMQGTTEKTASFNINFLEFEYSGADPDNEIVADGNTNPDVIAPLVEDNRLERDYFMVEYFVQEGTAEKRDYFIYELGSGGIAYLDRLFVTDQLMGKHYPNIYFRLMGTKLTDKAYKNTDEYKSSVTYARRLNLDWLELSDQIHKSAGSIKDVTQMLISCQLPVNSSDALINAYGYEYFYGLYNQMPKIMAQSAYSNVNSNYINGFAKDGQTIQIKDKVYANRISFNAIGYEDKSGSIGDIGTVKMARSVMYVEQRNKPAQFAVPLPVHTFSKQVTAKTYRVITIYGLTSTQEVTGGYTTTASGDSDNLMLPLDESILNKFKMRDRNQLYSKSLVIIFNTTKVVKTKWYQSKVFQAIMFVAAVVLSVWTGGQSLTVYAVLYAVAQTVVIGLVLKLVVKFLVEKLGMNIGGLFAVIAIVLIAYGGAALLSNSGSIMSLTSAQFMQLANYSVQISSMADQLTMKKMLKAQATYYDMMQEKFDELGKIEDDMQLDPIVNPAFLLSDGIRGPDIRIESMNNFLIRTLSVDMGLATLDTIPNMVALTVRLPSFEELYAKYAEQRELTI